MKSKVNKDDSKQTLHQEPDHYDFKHSLIEGESYASLNEKEQERELVQGNNPHSHEIGDQNK